ncbi:dmX-like protein 2 [Condylostylus longicornis]|uniref:dmX-like protein 2 n=1 Tax=Condylostylus longicornis TaxID=2530218 RepID=UPI00244E4E85|nr:dmX-like protein 2 [Condylostylus longicornis]
MNRHQVLSGACNAGDRCYAVGSVEGIPFTAYAAGCNIVILASSFERVQIIPGAIHGYVKISALDCSTDTGKIAAAYENKIYIFEPTPIIQDGSKTSSHNLDYKWVRTGKFSTKSFVIVLSWSLEGTRLLTGGEVLDLWKEKTRNKPKEVQVKFEIGGTEDPKDQQKDSEDDEEDDTSWECVWSCKSGSPVQYMAFSSDGSLFATCGKNDRLVKIWYENKNVIFPTQSIDTLEYSMRTMDESELNYHYVYIAHPRAVTHLSWRRTSKYMPKTSVCNMLVTSCLDNICRVWVETVLPDDGLVNMMQFDPQASKNPKFRTHRHKRRFIQRLKHMKACFHIRRNARTGTILDNLTSHNQARNSPIPSLPSSYSVHDFHSYGYHSTGIITGMHFHLAASINAETDIPLVPSMQTRDPENQMKFILHWLNNKEMYFSSQADIILYDLTHKLLDKEDYEQKNVYNADNSSDPDDKQTQAIESNSKLSKIHSQEESCSDEQPSNKHTGSGVHNSNVNSMSDTASYNSSAHNAIQTNPIDTLDIKIEALLRDWHRNPDLLFSIHPVDGSFLIWVLEWLDDYYPGSFRQAQISFSTRIPSAFPLGDAMSISNIINLYNLGNNSVFLKNMLSKDNTVKDSSGEQLQNTDKTLQEEDENVEQTQNVEKLSVVDDKTEKDQINLLNQSHICMVTKHANGTLNLWQLNFADKTKYTQLLSVNHVSRTSGHRFRVNDITCHPVLPLLLTTSHHNIPETENEEGQNSKEQLLSSGFCSELILWKVDPVGPLSYSGGVSELARISSPEISAFSNVAWIPTLLPSTTLGSYSNSPSACFVASDGKRLRVYQAVIDARALLAEISNLERKLKHMGSVSSISTASSGAQINLKHEVSLHENIKIVSQQSTSRPGCIIQLDPIDDAFHDWKNTQFLHVFQDQLILGERDNANTIGEGVKDKSFMESHMGAAVDLQKKFEFKEPFYIVILEKTKTGSVIHMWKITIASKRQISLPDTNLYTTEAEVAANLENTQDVLPETILVEEHESPHISIVTKKVCTQELPLPKGVDVINASPAAGHLSSASIYPACFAPYLFMTASTDSVLRFWKCRSRLLYDKPVDESDEDDSNVIYEWGEWDMFKKDKHSSIEVSGQLLHISAAYSGRIACAYKYGKSFTRPNKADPESRFINLCVVIYECESTGGSEWILEDTIHLRNVSIPKVEIDHNLDLSYLNNTKVIEKRQRINHAIHTFTNEDNRTTWNNELSPDAISKPGIFAVPSYSTLQSLKKSIIEKGNTCPLVQKHLVQLDWVSKEDGSHILTVAFGSKILLYTPVSSDLAQANIKAMKESRSKSRPLLRKTSSLAQPHFNDEIRWMKLRQIDLETADGLPPLPMHISWVRDGILVVGMDSEMHVYSQWKPRHEKVAHIDESYDSRNLRDEDLRQLANETSQLRLSNVASVSKISSANLQLLSFDKKRKMTQQNLNQNTGNATTESVDHDYLTDSGLFLASRIACPVLPQYHPKQLMELLNSGKIRWVKAILGHLVRCMSGNYNQGSSVGSNDEDTIANPNAWTRSRTLSISYMGQNSPNEQADMTVINEDLMLDYAEIASIPPLPLWVLLTADKERPTNANKENDPKNLYENLFDLESKVEDSLDDVLASDTDMQSRNERRQSMPEKTEVSSFGPRQGRLLSRLLTHMHLPGLSSLDQMHLLALADTVSTCNTDFSEKFAEATLESSTTKDDGNQKALSIDSLDDCGLRFLLAMKHYDYLLRCLPMNQRGKFQVQGVGTSNIVWAFHSESEEELLSLIPSYNKGQIKWATLRELGVGWWLRNVTVLRKCIEQLAKSAYQSKQDPLDAALYYLAMKKKSIVWGLFRSQKNEKMTEFFANNFSEDRWRRAALKNAFVLLGKQRFEHAIGFFLLANSLNDAIEVCLNKLKDFQLALVICRLFEPDIEFSQSSYKKLLDQEILGLTPEDDQIDTANLHPDPFLRSITFWIMKNFTESLNTLLLNNVGQNHHAYSDEDMFNKTDNANAANPNVFNFYIYLRTHPLLIRHQLATSAQETKHSKVMLSGFSYAGQMGGASNNQLHVEDSITHLERQLYFTTAHGHFKSGCPVLALEVLNKLPAKVLDSSASTRINSIDIAESFDGNFTTSTITQPAADQGASMDFDWGAPVTKYDDSEFKITWDDDENEEKEDDDLNKDEEKKTNIVQNIDKKVIESNQPIKQIDIMAQQLKFVACLKILMEELSTLATGFEVDGGHLRFQLYVWLEREVEALKQLCSYRILEEDILEEPSETIQDDNSIPRMSEKPALHEILLQEKQNFEARVQRATRRKKWLKANETLLRTLLSYCSLHGACGGGLASVRMELILLLQELQQEKTQQQLLSPLPFPTTLPLLSACIAGNKTVVSDPIKYLQVNTQDMLQAVTTLNINRKTEKENIQIFILRDLAVALSSCIYQSLCDSENFIINQCSIGNTPQIPGMENIAKLNYSYNCSHLIMNKRKNKSLEEKLPITTLPTNWPGVTNLRALLTREKDEDAPRLNILLLEAFLATYTSLLVYGLETCDSHILFRLAGQIFSKETWGRLFGGGAKIPLKKATTESFTASMAKVDSTESNVDVDTGVWNTVTSFTKQRVKLNMKLLGQFSSPNAGSMSKEESKEDYREQFVAPELSMVSYFLTKPVVEGADDDDYDTDNSVIDSEEEDDDGDVFMDKKSKNKDNVEHLNPHSYSWTIIRCALVKLVQQKIQQFIQIAGIESHELPVTSPFAHDVLKTLKQWEDDMANELALNGPPSSDFIPGCFVDSEAKGPTIHKYRNLLEKHNTPFISSSSAAPAKRLWNYLVRQEHVQDIFIRSVFGKKRHKTSITVPSIISQQSFDQNDSIRGDDVDDSNMVQPIKIIHKEQESISAFCVNNTSCGLLAIATPKEIQELDISLLLNTPSYYEDECEYDLLNLSKDVDAVSSTSFLIIQTNAERQILNNIQNGTQPQSSIAQLSTASQSGRGTSMVLKHKIDNVKRMSAHPHLPFYLTGGQDGSVQLWEWGRQQVVCTPRPPGTFAKVTRCRFSQHGNKFGIADGDGNMSLWQAGIASYTNRSFFNYQCHNKSITDFDFLGSCSLLATAGHSSENKNIAIWDTLLPQKKALVQAFVCHDQGASSLIYAPQHQLLLSSGKKGDICIFDVRQRVLKHKFQAHDSPIKCMAVDPHEEIFVTGSAEGGIKVWNLAHNNLMYEFPAEHAKGSFFKHLGQGVSQILLDSDGRLFSCGCDGSMKVRQLPSRCSVVNAYAY